MLAPSVRTWPVAALCLMYCGLRTTPVRGEKVAAAYVSIVSRLNPPPLFGLAFHPLPPTFFFLRLCPRLERCSLISYDLGK